MRPELDPSRGWSGETLPKGLRRGDAKPVCVWDTGKRLELELVYVPPGDFIMGADDQDAFEPEKPKRTQALDQGFWIGRTDVTWQQYGAFCAATNHEKPDAPRLGIKPDHPVVNVSWDDLHGEKGFLAWAGVSLPAEAEWEKAARGTDGRKYPWGSDAPTAELCNFGQDFKTGSGTSAVTAHLKGASPYGALDMAGNVWQWCEDLYSGPQFYEDLFSGPSGVLRGSRWIDDARHSRSSFRIRFAPHFRFATLGFRVVLR